MTSPAPPSSSTSSSTYRRWEPLPKIQYGFAVAPFAPEPESLGILQDEADPEAAFALLQPHIIGLEVGDEVYIFEQLGHQDVIWLRGYVVSTNRIPTTATSTSSLSDYSAFPSTSTAGASLVEEPQVYVGIFPKSNVHIREELDDAEMRLTEVYEKAREASIVGATAPPPAKQSLVPSHMETLPEEDESISSQPNSPSAPEFKSSEASRASAAGNTKVAFDSSRQSFILQDMQASEERPPPPLPSLKCGDDTKFGSIEPLVDEIACALREWSTQMYVYLGKRDYALFHIVREHIEALHIARRQLLAQTLSEEEVAKLRRDCVARLVKGNVQQGLDVIVRHPGRGGLVDVDFTGKDSDPASWISGVQLYALQSALAYVDHDSLNNVSSSITSNIFSIMSQASSTGLLSTPLSVTAGKRGLTRQASINIAQRQTEAPFSAESKSDIKYFHVYLDLRAFVASPCQLGEHAELYFSLYNKAESRFLTEEFCVILNHQGVPLRNDKLGKLCALFSDLSANDMHDLNVVCRIVRNGSMRSSSTDNQKTAISDTIDNALNVSTSNVDSVQEGSTGYRSSRMVSSHTFRRPFGCAVVELGQNHSFDSETSSSSVLQEHTMPIFVPVNEATFSTLHQDIIASRLREFEKSPRADSLAIGVKVLHGEKNTLIRENPGLLQDTALTARLGFPDVVFPGDTRNEVYVKLWSGEFFPTGSKVPGGSTAKNMQVSAEVRTRDGSVIEKAISRGAGEDPVTQFDSSIFYHQNSPTWGELFKLQIPSELMEQCHIFFTFRHRSTKEEKLQSAQQLAQGRTIPQSAPYAHAYLPLFESNNAFIPDGTHTLLLWRSSRPSHNLSPELYFTLSPSVSSSHDAIPPSLTSVIQPLRDTVTLRSFLVSAKYTQNEVLLKLLNWEKVLVESVDELKAVLVKFAFVSEAEIVKFLRNIFDALFGIVVSPKNGSGDLDDLVFNSLVTVLGIVQDRRFNNFRATLDVYIEQHYHSQTAYTRLMASMSKLLADPARSEVSKDLRAAIKVWPYIFKFIIRGRENQRGVKDNIGALGGAVSDHFETSFRADLDALLRAINRLMSTTKPNSIIGTQTLALQNFAGILPELARVFPMDELARIETAFTDSVFVTTGRMAVWKLLHILHVTHDALFDNHNARSQMLPSMVRWVRPHLGRYDESSHASPGDHENALDTARIAWVEGARLAVTIIAVVLDKLQINLVSGRKGKKPPVEMRQEQDNVDYILSMMPKLLETYKVFASPLTKDAITRHRSPSTVSSTVPVIFPSVYPFPLISKLPDGELAHPPSRSSRRHQRKVQQTYLNCGLGEIASVLTVLVMLSPRRHLSGFLDEQLDIDGKEKLGEFLMNFFEVATSILLNEAFPSSWLNINILCHQMVLKMADPVAALLVRDFIPPADQSESFDTALWRNGLNMLLTLLSSEQLVIERFKPQRRRAVWRLSGDIRGEGAQIFSKLWNAIGWPDHQKDEASDDQTLDLGRLNTGGFQVQFVPSLVEPVLELCLSHHDELRTCAVRVLATMITSEWHLNGNFSVIEAEIIDKLDVLFIADTQGDEISRAFFIGQLRSLFECPQVDPRLQKQVHLCLLSVNRFLDLLLSVRSLPLEEGFEDDRVSGTLKLLGFLRQANRVTAFSTHVLRLVNLHLENQNFIEAALTLKLHADLHQWDLDSFVEPISDLDLPRQSHFARKETLYMLILDYLNKGNAWEISIDVCRELAREYEYRAVDYNRLADVLTTQASLFQKIGSEERSFPNYFRVAYYGSQWPTTLQGKNFIYRGNNWEKFSNFCERMHQRHPRATLIKSSMEPNDEIRFSTNMFLQIMPVNAEADRTKEVFVNTETPPIVRAYYEHNTTNLFSFARPIAQKDINNSSSENSLANLWVEKTFLRTEDSFPTVLRRSEIASVEIVRISPLENALSDVESKAKELETLEAKYLSLSKIVTPSVALNTNRLSMALNGAVDAPINGGIPMYKKAFYSTAYVSEHPNEEETLHRLRTAIDRQASVIYRCLSLHNRLCPAEMRPFHETLERFFKQNFAEEITRLNLDVDALSGEARKTTEAEREVNNSATGPLTMNSFEDGVEVPSLGGTLSMDAISAHGGVAPSTVVSPLQRHIGYLSKQAHPIKASPTAHDISVSKVGRGSSKVGVPSHQAAASASVVASSSAPVNLSSQKTHEAPSSQVNRKNGTSSLMSEKTTTSRLQESIFSKVTEGKERASRLLGSTRRR